MRKFLVASLILWQTGVLADTAEFYDDVIDKDRASFSETMIGISLLRSRAIEPPSFETARDALRQAGILPEDWNYAADSPVTKSMLAYLVCKTLGIKGGVTMRLFGITERYALRECIHLGLIGEGPPTRYIPGRELLGVLRRSQEYKQGRESP